MLRRPGRGRYPGSASVPATTYGTTHYTFANYGFKVKKLEASDGILVNKCQLTNPVCILLSSGDQEFKARAMRYVNSCVPKKCDH